LAEKRREGELGGEKQKSQPKREEGEKDEVQQSRCRTAKTSKTGGERRTTESERVEHDDNKGERERKRFPKF